MVDEWGIVISISRARSHRRLRQSHWWVMGKLHWDKENGNIFQQSREFGIKLHGTKKAQGRNGLCANWNIHLREQGDSLNKIGTLC